MRRSGGMPDGWQSATNTDPKGGLVLKHIHASDDWREKSVGQKGFTLIELLVVIAILGILAVVAILGVGALRDRGEDEACQTQERSVQAAVVAYMADNGGAVPTTGQLLSGNYIDKTPNPAVTINGTTGDVNGNC